MLLLTQEADGPLSWPKGESDLPDWHALLHFVVIEPDSKRGQYFEGHNEGAVELHYCA